MWLIIFAAIVVVIAAAINSYSNKENTSIDYENASVKEQVNTKPLTYAIKNSSPEEDLINLILEELSSKLIKKLWDICQHPYGNDEDHNIVTICRIIVFQYGICAKIESTYDNSTIDFNYPFTIHQVSEIHSFEKACNIAQKISDGLSYKTAMLWEFYDGVYRDEERNWKNGSPYDCITHKIYATKNLTKEQISD